MIVAASFWDWASRYFLVYLLLALNVQHGVFAHSTTTIIVTSKTITGTTTITNTPSLLTNCDGVGTFFCPTGTCYTGHDGFIGCCTISSCAARTTCIAYTENVVQMCNVDVGGCVACSSAAPSCITIQNIAMSQYIMYCDTFSTVATLSYANLITYGSMAFPPALSSRTTALVASGGLFSALSTQSDTILTATGAFIASGSVGATPPNMIPDFSGLSRGAVAGITVSCVIVVAAAIIAFLIMLRKRRSKAQRDIYEKSRALDEHQNVTDGMIPTEFGGQGGENSPRRLQKIPGPRGGGSMMSRADMDYPSESLSPTFRHGIVRSEDTRDTEHAHELDATATPSTVAIFYTPEFSPELDQSTRFSWCNPPQTSRISEGDISAQHFVSNVSSSYKQHLPDTEIRHNPSEPSTIRQIYPSGNYNSSPTPSYPVSPDPDAHLTSPLLGGVSPQTPLMSKWQASDHASVGRTPPTLNPAAMLDAPIKWPSTEGQLSRGCDTVGENASEKIERSLTSARGVGAGKYISPEVAMVEGLGMDCEDRNERA